MKFSKSISVLTVVGLAYADLATIQGILTNIGQQSDALDSAVKAWNGGDYSALTSAGQQLLSTINNGVQTVSGTSPLTETDALSLAGGVQGLQTSVDNVVNDFIAKHDALVAAGAGATVEQSFQDEKTASQALVNAITSKVPQSLQSLAAQLSGGVAASLQKAIDAFQGAGGSAPGSSGASGPTSSGSGTPTSSGSSGSTTSTGRVPPSVSCSMSFAASTPSLPSTPTVSLPNGPSVPAIVPSISGGSEPLLPSTTGLSSSPAAFTGAATKLEYSALAFLGVAAAIFA